jgi:GDP-L-fucose synthase
MPVTIFAYPVAHAVSEGANITPAAPAADSKIFVAGHRGLVGSAIVRKLESAGYSNLLLRTSKELDLRNSTDVSAFFEAEKPEFVFLAAAKVGGIMANDTYRGDFIRDNLLIQLNVIDSARRNGAAKLMFLGSTCIYPREAPQPIKEDYLMTGPLEPTNSAYAVAKIAGLEMIDAYRTQYGFNGISIMPTNLYGPQDSFDPETSHVLPALIRRIHVAKMEGANQITIWGTGTPLREFMHCDDLADAALWLMSNYDDTQMLNVGTGEEISILDLAILISKVVGFEGEIATDPSKPDGTPRKLCDVTRLMNLGWRPKITLEDGIRSTYDWFLENEAKKS